MNDDVFNELRTEIDKAIDKLGDAPSGIKMGFGLAGAFLIRGLLETAIVDMLLFKWDMRAYRGRFVYPDPMLEEYEFIIGQRAE